jgi:hypothetical protein
MRRRIVLLAISLSAAGVLAPSAHAAGGSVAVSVTAVKQPVGAGLVTAALCEANATPGPGEIPALTSVWCTINSTEVESLTITAIGPEAAVTLANASDNRPIEVCVNALAVFTPTIGPAYTATKTLCKFV